MSWSTVAINNLAKEQERLERVDRAAMIRLATQTATASPVDSGLFRANWIGSYGSINRETFSDKGRDSIGEFNILLGSNGGNHNFIYLTNSMPYALRLEYGWSLQAPAGVVRVTARNFPRYVREANATTR